MLSFNESFQAKLKEGITLQNNKTNLSSYFDWIEDGIEDDINFWSFLSLNVLELSKFFTLLDVEAGPCGWEKFIESLGLINWEDREWCHLYHNGIGPTRAALSKIVSKVDFDPDLSLKAVLLLLKEMDRLDILKVVDWISLIDNFKKGKGNSVPQHKSLPQHHIINLKHELEIPLQSFAIQQRGLKDKNPNYKKKAKCPYILLTYASDAVEYAIQIADQLKTENLNRSCIKVVMLHSLRAQKALLADPNNVVHSWFLQARYIVPILSPKYLHQIQNPDSESSHESLHNRRLYRLLLDQFVSYGSKNYRCRPVCPDKFCLDIKGHSVLDGNGLFTIQWSDSKEKIEELAQVLMDVPSCY